MELLPTSKLSFLDQNGKAIVPPKEWLVGWIELHDVLQNWENIRLVRQEYEELPISLKRFGGQTRLVAEWPRSGPGRYRLQLFSENELLEEQYVTLQPSKISTEAYERLVEDLETRLPASIALALQRAGAFTGLSLLPPAESTLAMELVRLKRAIHGTAQRPGLAQILRTIARSPHQILHSTELWISYEQARRPHASRLMEALSKPYNLEENGRPRRVLDTRVEHSVDVYENRLLKVFWQLVHLRLLRLESLLMRQSNKVLLEDIQKLSATLRTARQEAAFLHDVTLPSHLPTQVTMVLSRHPLYRAVLQGYLEFHRSPMVRLEEPSLAAPLQNLPYLYQIWGTLQVLVALLETSVELGYNITYQKLARRDTQDIYLQLLPDSKPLVILVHPVHGTTVSIIPERTYVRSSAISSNDFYSFSFEQRPDVAIEIHQPNRPSRIYLFDPKYKLSRGNEEDEATPKKEDIDKMHAYRDAIRDREQGNVVQYAAILYPGPTQHYHDGLEALQAYPGLESSLQERLKSLFSIALSI